MWINIIILPNKQCDMTSSPIQLRDLLSPINVILWNDVMSRLKIFSAIFQ